MDVDEDESATTTQVLNKENNNDEDLLDEFEGELIYGFNDDIDHLMLLGQILDAQTPRDIHHYSDYSNTKFNNDKLRVIRISKQNEKHFKNNERFKHVSDFFQKIENCDEQ